MALTRKDTSAGKKIIVAGATGQLGQQIIRFLLDAGSEVVALVRNGAEPEKINALRKTGAEVITVKYSDSAALIEAFRDGHCVVSALSGLREVIVDAQTQLLDAALKAGVPRFIPSDYSIDYTGLPAGTNRNLDLRREFAGIIDNSPIQATSVLNGMFTDLLTGQAPVVLFGLKRVIYWGNKEQLMDFTTIRDTAAFTATAALDPKTPRYLRIAGEVASAGDLQQAASQATGKPFKTFRAGSIDTLETIIRITKTVFPQPKEVFPAWQGMEYLRDMSIGLVKLHPLDNARYPHLGWTSVRDVLATR